MRTIDFIAILLGLLLTAQAETAWGDEEAPEHELAKISHVVDAGLNLGWLSASLETGFAAGSRPIYCKLAGTHFNHSFSPPKEVDPPLPRPDVALRYQATVLRTYAAYASRTQDRKLRASAQLFRAAHHLARAQTFAQHGKEPNAMYKEMEAAAQMFAQAGKVARSPGLLRVAKEIDSLSKRVNRFGATGQTREFANPIAQIIVLVRKGFFEQAETEQE